jgi:hypothetical protein
MNERATEVTNESEEPENQQHNKDSPEHMFSFELVYFASHEHVRLRVKIFQISRLGKLLAARGRNRYNPSDRANRHFMRIKFLIVLLLALSLNSGAFAAIVTEKQSRQVPYVEVFEGHGVHSFIFRGPVGTSRKPLVVPPEEYWTAAREAGLYKFVLRYHSGNVCSRLVTPEVFARYRVGDDFRDSDLTTEAVTEDNKSVQPVVHHHKRTAEAKKRSHTTRRLAKHHQKHRALRVASR